MIKVGDKVCYSRQWLQSVGIYTGNLPRARGIVEDITSIGDKCDIVVVQWDCDDIPPRVNVKNLSKITPEKGVEELS